MPTVNNGGRLVWGSAISIRNDRVGPYNSPSASSRNASGTERRVSRATEA
jgi:hypothetical protein